MRRLAGCLVVSLLASAAAWVGCRDDLGDEALPLLVGAGTDAGVGGDAYGGGTVGPDAIVTADDARVLADGSGEGGPPDADAGSGIGSDGPGAPDADSGSGGGSDAGGMSDGGGTDSGALDAGGGGEGGMPDGGSDGGSGSGDGGSGSDGGGGNDGGGMTASDAAGRPDARRGPELDPVDRTSFYACTGGPASAGLEVGVPIALALAIAVRRRRRWRAAGSPDRTA